MFRIVSRSIQMNRMISNRFNQPVFVQQIKNYSDKPTQTSDECENSPEKLGGFAKAFNEMEHMINKPEEPVVETVPFKKLLRNSKFVDLGDPLNKIVSGRIVHTVDEDLYIDFGWKFNCVCRVPEKNGHLYVRGATVKLKIKELELSSRFLGEEKDLTILEADCELLGLLTSPKLKKN